MTRKDSEKDADRPHYYSQFWLDIAAGRRVIGGPRPDEAEASEPEVLEPAPVRKVGRNNGSVVADGFRETYQSPVIETIVEEDEVEQATTVEDDELPNIVLDDSIEEMEDEAELDEEAEEESADEPFYGEEEEEEEDEEWNPRGRKKAKPVKPVKPVKKAKREPRRSGF